MRRLLAVALMALGVVPLAGCGGAGSSGTETLTVYVSLPLSGERAADGRAVQRGAKDALEQAGGEAGGVRVRAVYLDDTGQTMRWDPVATAANARRAAEDTSTIAYIGDIDDGATRTSLPITNQADILQISPGSTAVDLTRKVSARLDPDLYRPSGNQTFVRLVPAADVTGLRACPPAAYGREAMALVLTAIEDGGKDVDRAGVIDSVKGTRNRESPIGTYSVDANGDAEVKAGTGC